MRHKVRSAGSGWERRMLGAAVIVGVLTMTVNAQWTVVNLHPEGASKSEVRGVYGDQQVGYVTVDGNTRASLWNGSAASWIDLNPAGAPSSYAYATDGNQQVGAATPFGSYNASLWSGSAASWINLNPDGAIRSQALGVGGGQQVGYAEVGGRGLASLWSGTAASWVSLSPGWESFSCAYGAQGGQQVGVVGGLASLWSGSAASWVNLNPTDAQRQYQSGALAVYEGQQVGCAAEVGGHEERASLWRGSAESWIDLHAFLPSDYTNSNANGIWSDESHTYVVGYGYNATVERYEALMWIGPVPEPASGLVLCAAMAMFRRRSPSYGR